MKSLSTHITESFVNESVMCVLDLNIVVDQQINNINRVIADLSTKKSKEEDIKSLNVDVDKLQAVKKNRKAVDANNSVVKYVNSRQDVFKSLSFKLSTAANGNPALYLKFKSSRMSDDEIETIKDEMTAVKIDKSKMQWSAKTGTLSIDLT